MPGVPQTIGMNPNIDTTIVEVKTLEILRSSTLGVALTATAQNPQTLTGGRGIYFVPNLVQTKKYVFANRNNNPDALKVDKVYVDIDRERYANYEIESFDVSKEASFGAWNSVIAANLSNDVLAEIDCELIMLAKETAVKNGQYIVNDKYSTARTKEELLAMMFDTIDQQADLLGTVDRKTLGTNKIEVATITNMKAFPRYIAASGGNLGTDQLQSGSIQYINGVSLIPHVFIGKAIPAGSSFSLDVDYDMSDVEAITLHSEAIALPFSMNTIVSTIGENSGNQKIVMKYSYGIQVIRELLIYAILNTETETMKANRERLTKVRKAKLAEWKKAVAEAKAKRAEAK